MHLMDNIKHIFVLSHAKTISVTVSVSTIAITNIDVNVWTWKNEPPQGKYLCYLM